MYFAVNERNEISMSKSAVRKRTLSVRKWDSWETPFPYTTLRKIKIAWKKEM